MEKCSYCGRKNPYEARYCSNCATPLIEDPYDPRLSPEESLAMLQKKRREAKARDEFIGYGGSLLLGIQVIGRLTYITQGALPGWPPLVRFENARSTRE